MITGLIRSVQNYGLQNTLASYQQKFLPRPLVTASTYIEKFAGKSCLELGGPSSIFSANGLIPIYPALQSLDGCNFSNETTWEGKIQEGQTYNYRGENSIGKQYVSEGCSLKNMENEQYDGVLSSHMIEHTANPIATLYECKRVLKNNGWFLIVIPHKEGTFDHRRPVTQLSHLIEDYEKSMDESDLTHLDEILSLHDLSRDPLAGDLEQFKERSKKNFENRCLHHHVFNAQLASELLSYVGFKVQHMDLVRPCHIIVLCQKNESRETTSFDLSEIVKRSPFSSDMI